MPTEEIGRTRIRAQELWSRHKDQIYRQTDRLFAGLLIAEWLGAIGVALVVSPRTWIGAASEVNIHVWAAIFLGGAISIPPALLSTMGSLECSGPLTPCRQPARQVSR